MYKNSLLWQISNDQGPVSFIFGTMHVKDELAFSHVETVKSYMRSCTHFKTEIDLNALQTGMDPRFYRLPSGKNLELLLGTKKFLKLESQFAKAFKLDIKAYRAMLPIVTVNALAEATLRQDHTYPLDTYLWNEAESMGLTCSGIETIAEHLAILAQLDIESQLKMLCTVARDTRKYKLTVRLLANCYAEQRINQLYKRTKKSLGAFRKVLLYDRNYLMHKRIIANMAHPSLYAVGAAHLAGDKGIIALLKRDGLKLTPISKSRSL